MEAEKGEMKSPTRAERKHMKKYINGKKYDTETAKEVVSRSHNAISDFSWYEETLYRKKTGEFFLHGEGHAASPYRERNDAMGMWGPGSAIKPLTFEEARAWAEENLSGDEYESIFGEIADDDTECLISAIVKASSRDRLRRRMEQTGKTAGQILDELIEGAL